MPSMKDKRADTVHDDLLRELTLLIRSRYGLIWLKTAEEDRARNLVRYLAAALNLMLFVWTPTKGLCRDDLDEPIYGTSDPKAALDHIQYAKSPAIFYFQSLSPFLEDRLISAKLADTARCFTRTEGAVILSGAEVSIPQAAMGHTAVVTPPVPGREEFQDLLRTILKDLKSRTAVKVDLTARNMNVLLKNLNGLTLVEAEKVLTKAIIEDGCLDAADIDMVIQEKRRTIEREGLLEFIPTERSFADIADLSNLKSWLAKRRHIITDPEGAAEFGLPFPRGILLLGVPGSGKSLCAKAVAMEWGLPLLRMDPSRLYCKYVGESEKNYRRAMETAEKLAPVVLWIDEIEKALPPGEGHDSGVSQRVLGSFLSWLQERKGDVFVTATANDIDKLPPELLRKGRFDEIFFVDLPDTETRQEIFRIHIKRRGHEPERFDLPALAQATQGFTGAEIEQAVVSTLYTAFSEGGCLTADLMRDEIGRTQPLSKVRAEHIEALRAWASGRTVPAN
jgi:hypothetical protein